MNRRSIRLAWLFASLAFLCTSAIGATSFQNEAGWRLTQSFRGPIRLNLTIFSPDGDARYEATTSLVNEAAEFDATLIRKGLPKATVHCSLAQEGAVLWVKAMNPPAGVDPSGRYLLREDLRKATALSDARTDYGKADAELNEIYRKTLGMLDAAGQKDLREKQRVWLEKKERLAAEGAENDPGYWETLADLTRGRIEFLQSGYAGKEVTASVSGTYSDEEGGLLSIRERGTEWVFAIQVVRGPSAHTGFIRGVAQVQNLGKAARFVDSDKSAFSDQGPAVIEFKVRGNRLLVTARNTEHYHGARAYFDGEYFKLTDLIETFPSVR